MKLNSTNRPCKCIVLLRKGANVFGSRSPEAHGFQRNRMQLANWGRRQNRLAEYSRLCSSDLLNQGVAVKGLPTLGEGSREEDDATSSSTQNDVGNMVSTSSDGDGVKIDLDLPRRSLQVSFTCNLCNGRTERLVNPIAWKRGMVIAQCAQCEAWHKLADEANLVEEIRYADLEE